MTTRGIQVHFEEAYDVEVYPTLISQVTNAVMDEVLAWRNRPLDGVYLIVYLDALVLHSRDCGAIQNKHIYLALGISFDGERELPAYEWLSQKVKSSDSRS